MVDTELSEDPSSHELADTRTAWAEDRTMLANERTFAGWMRTGMACVALALGLKAVFDDTAQPLIAKAVAEVCIIVAILIFWAAATNSRKAQKQMDDHDVHVQSHRRMTTLAITRGLPGKYVDTFAFSDGRFGVRWKGVSIPYSVFDKDQRVTHAAIIENKHLSAVLEHIKAEQDEAAPKNRRAGKQATRYVPNGRRCDGWNSKLARRAKEKAAAASKHAAE